MLTALDHVIVLVRDLDSARDSYSALLGLEPSWRGVHPGAGTSNVLFRIENTYLELLSPSGEGPLGDLLGAWLEEHGEGPIGLAFQTDDIEGVRSALEERGLEPMPVERGHGRDSVTGAERRWRRVGIPISRTRGVIVFVIQHDSPADALPMAEPAGEAGASVHALDHAVVQTTNASAAKQLYGDGLGIRLALDREFPDWGVHLMFFRVGGVTIEVAAALGGTDPSTALPGAQATPDKDRVWGLSWRVADLDAARARLVAAGVDVSDARPGRRPNTRVFTVRSGACGVPTLILEVNPSAS